MIVDRRSTIIETLWPYLSCTRPATAVPTCQPMAFGRKAKTAFSIF